LLKETKQRKYHNISRKKTAAERYAIKRRTTKENKRKQNKTKLFKKGEYVNYSFYSSK
jgi:hypothetical protein